MAAENKLKPLHWNTVHSHRGRISERIILAEKYKGWFPGFLWKLHQGGTFVRWKKFPPDFDPPRNSPAAGPVKLFVYNVSRADRESPKSSQAGQYGRKVEKARFTATPLFLKRRDGFMNSEWKNNVWQAIVQLGGCVESGKLMLTLVKR